MLNVHLIALTVGLR